MLASVRLAGNRCRPAPAFRETIAAFVARVGVSLAEATTIQLPEISSVPEDIRREPVHTRQIACRAYRRADDLYEIEATLTDEKGEAVAFRSRPAVGPAELMHHMTLTLVIDADYLIRDASARTLKGPWSMCGGADDAYRRLIGLRIGAGFNARVREILGGTEGCTHLSDLLAQIANTYMQASWPGRIARAAAVDPDPRSWRDKGTLGFVDQCHAWRQDGETLRREYPELLSPKKD